MKYLTGCLLLISIALSARIDTQVYKKAILVSEADLTEYSYCKPDEDPSFTQSAEDDLYYYYDGEEEIRGYLFQQGPEKPLFFHTGINQSCKFRLTKEYIPISKELNLFDIEKAWAEASECKNMSGKPSLTGEYSIRVKGFRISKSYIEQYDPCRIMASYYLNRYSFALNFDGIEKVHRQSMVICPQILH